MTKFILLESSGYENCLFQWPISLLHLQPKCSLCPPGWDLTPVVLISLLKCGSAVLSDSFSPAKHFSFKYLTLEPSKEQVGWGGVSLDGIYDREKYRCR